MTYIPQERAFNLTCSKLRRWHSPFIHQSSDCIFCHGSMGEIAKYLRQKGLVTTSVGSGWIKIKAEKNYGRELGGTTDETRLLYELVSGRKSAPPEFTDAPAVKKKPIPKYQNQTEIGKLFNLSSIAMGKKLDEFGFRDSKTKEPLTEIIKTSMVSSKKSSNGITWLWNREELIKKLTKKGLCVIQ